MIKKPLTLDMRTEDNLRARAFLLDDRDERGDWTYLISGTISTGVRSASLTLRVIDDDHARIYSSVGPE